MNVRGRIILEGGREKEAYTIPYKKNYLEDFHETRILIGTNICHFNALLAIHILSSLAPGNLSGL